MLTAKWTGTGAGIAGALLVAADIPASGYGFILFLVSSVCWAWVGIRTRDLPLALLQGVFTAINLLGIWRWLF